MKARFPQWTRTLGRLALILLLIGIMMGGVTACGGAEKPSSGPTPVPATATPVPPTATPVPPTDTPVPATATSEPPTVAPASPTDTPAPATSTPEPAAATGALPAAYVSTTCSACHGDKAEGLIGPILIGLDPDYIRQTVRNGIANTIMASFDASQISDADLEQLVQALSQSTLADADITLPAAALDALQEAQTALDADDVSAVQTALEQAQAAVSDNDGLSVTLDVMLAHLQLQDVPYLQRRLATLLGAPLAASGGDNAPLEPIPEAYTTATCFTCHGPQGEGLIGPILVGLDSDYITTVARQGVPDTAMVAYGPDKISDEDLAQLARAFSQRNLADASVLMSIDAIKPLEEAQQTFKAGDAAATRAALARAKDAAGDNPGLSVTLDTMIKHLQAGDHDYLQRRFETLLSKAAASAVPTEEPPEVITLPTEPGPTRQQGEILCAIHDSPILLSPDDIESHDGTLYVLSPLAVQEQKDGMVKVSLEGWQQDEAPSIIYALQGFRIRNALLGEEAQKHIEILDTVTDPNTDLVWHHVRLDDVWVFNSALTDDAQPTWDNTEALFHKSCSVCHALPSTERFTANQWPGILKTMFRRAALSRENGDLVRKYLQYNARDVGSMTDVAPCSIAPSP
ncbi:MAG: hypothetical protein DSY55_04655 [Clostridia bacterium]|nr:MAG: hypothetical protein DSY55_04655 [Clostridia bacterium]